MGVAISPTAGTVFVLQPESDVHPRGRNQKALVLHDPPPDQPLVMVRIDPYHEVVIVLDRIDLAILGDDLEFDLRVSKHEVGRDLGQQDMRQDDRRADP